MALGDILKRRGKVHLVYVGTGLNFLNSRSYLPLVGLLGLMSVFEFDELRLRRWFCG